MSARNPIEALVFVAAIAGLWFLRPVGPAPCTRSGAPIRSDVPGQSAPSRDGKSSDRELAYLHATVAALGDSNRALEARVAELERVARQAAEARGRVAVAPERPPAAEGEEPLPSLPRQAVRGVGDCWDSERSTWSTAACGPLFGAVGGSAVVADRAVVETADARSAGDSVTVASGASKAKTGS